MVKLSTNILYMWLNVKMGLCKYNDVENGWMCWKNENLRLLVKWYKCWMRIAVRTQICDAYTMVCGAYMVLVLLFSFCVKFATHACIMRRMVCVNCVYATHTILYAAHKLDLDHCYFYVANMRRMVLVCDAYFWNRSGCATHALSMRRIGL